jgi:hypothetical protein
VSLCVFRAPLQLRNEDLGQLHRQKNATLPPPPVGRQFHHIWQLRRGNATARCDAPAPRPTQGQNLPRSLDKQNDVRAEVECGPSQRLTAALTSGGPRPLPTRWTTPSNRRRAAQPGVELETPGEVSKACVCWAGWLTSMAGKTKRSMWRDRWQARLGVIHRQRVNLGAEWDLPSAPGLTVTGR